MMRLLDLFSGIGGFSLGLERTGGFQTVAFCEIEPFPRAVLAKHWPGVPCYDDVRTLTAERLAADGIAVDAICGGFPCQGISPAGKRLGLDDPRSGLWSEYARIIREVRPRWVLVENNPRLRTCGADRVFADLEAADYTAWPLVVGAIHAGAPHRRQRVWIIAHANSDRCRKRQVQHQSGTGGATSNPCGNGPPQDVPDADGDHGRSGRTRRFVAGGAWQHQPVGAFSALADTCGQCEQQPGHETEAIGGEWNARMEPCRCGDGQHFAPATKELADPDCAGLVFWQSIGSDDDAEFEATVGNSWWEFEPGLGRVADGVSNRVDRLTAIGNAIVPQIPEAIGRAILAVDRELAPASALGHEASGCGRVQDVSSLTSAGGVSSASGSFGATSCCTPLHSVCPSLDQTMERMQCQAQRYGRRGTTP